MSPAAIILCQGLTRWFRFYNQERHHQSIDDRPPDAVCLGIPHPLDAAPSAFNSRVLLRSHLVRIFEHNAPLLGARFSPDGKRILTWERLIVTRRGQQARIWHAESGEVTGKDLVHDKMVRE